MKKIKCLLLFGILVLLGIGSSFASPSPFFVEYFDSNNRYQNFIFDLQNHWGFVFGSANGGTFSNLDYVFYTGFSAGSLSSSDYFNTSSYILSNSPSSAPAYSSVGDSRLYVDGNNISLLFSMVSHRPYYYYLFNISNSVSSSDFLYLDGSRGYIRTLTNDGDGILIENPFKQSIFPSGVRSWIIQNNGVFDTSINQFLNDTEYSGVVYNRGSVSPGVFQEYAFSIVPTYNYDGSTFTIDYSTVPYLFRTVSPGISDSDWTSYRGVYILKLDSLYRKTNTGDFNILALSLSGDNYLYSKYSCPSNSVSFVNCSFLNGGYVGQSNLSNSFSSRHNTSFSVSANTSFSLFSDLSFYLSVPYYYTAGKIAFYTFPVIYSIESNNIVQLYRPLYYQASNKSVSYSSTLNNYSFGLIQSDGINILEEYFTGGGGNQSTGSIAINTGLINLCLTSSSFYELNTIFCNRVFGGRDLSYYQGLIGSGAYLQSYIDGSGNLVYVIDIVDEPGTLTGGVVWECYGNRCINTESGSWGDVEPWEILHLSGGDILSSGYYLGFFESINETGYFFKCPYSYNNSRWVAGMSILNKIGRDPFLPINCFIAAYENGRRVKLFDEAFNGYSWGPLMNGDTQNHRNLFTFFDILLSVALIFFLMKFYHLFK